MDAVDFPALPSSARLRKWLMIIPVMVAATLAVQRAASEGSAAGSTPLVGVTYKTHAPIALPSLDGPRHELAQFRGRVVLVHFFATWCEPCRAEMASLKGLQARIADRPLAIVPISVAEADGAVRRFFAEDPLPFPILLDRDRAVAKAWSIHTLPSTVVLDRTLHARFIAEGDIDWTRPDVMDTLAALLNEVPR
jgi:peroxiredoxin